MPHPDNDAAINPSSSESIREVLERVDPSRRRLMKGSLGAGMLAAFGGVSLDTFVGGASAAPAPAGGVGFAAVPPSLAPGMFDGVKVPAGYTARILSAWGDPIGHVSGSPQLDPGGPQSEASQLRQDGMNHDGIHFFPFPALGAGGVSSERGLLVTNHEYTDEGILHNELDPGATPQTLARVRTSQAAHGVSVKEGRKVAGAWVVVRPSAVARRITSNTPMTISGSAAGHALMKTSYTDENGNAAGDPGGRSVLGTVNNCAHGHTTWGTYLACEENWNGNFGTTLDFNADANERRYGVAAVGFGYRWHEADPRWDVRKNRNEPNRFGWVVEIDPWNPNSVPVKRTALGRFKHEGAWVVVGADNAVAVYLGDDERNEYIYKFVCSARFDPANRAANRNLLDAGIL